MASTDIIVRGFVLKRALTCGLAWWYLTGDSTEVPATGTVHPLEHPGLEEVVEGIMPQDAAASPRKTLAGRAHLPAPLPASGKHPIDRTARRLDAVKLARLWHVLVGEPEVQVVEKFRRFQAEVVKVARAVDRCNVH